MQEEIENRPNPDALLEVVEKEEGEKRRGSLKIFLGMCPGVGKTYAMLQAAQVELNNGKDVVIGFVETHGRKETEQLTKGIPIIPRKIVHYRDILLEEMDLDAILKRKPQLVLVDELAHTNAPGMRHLKRYQDVLEILDAGIDVFTTLNVQHIESRTDMISQITGAPIYEKVPDSIVDMAEIELVDLSPEDLLKRLAEGKVYIPEQARAAALNFFKEGNLRALREIVLRLAAEKAGKDVQEYMQIMHILGPWKISHRLLVAVSASPSSETLIRWTRRHAESLKCPWYAVYVETSRVLSEEDQQRLSKNIELAKELGAEIITTTDEDIVRGIIRIAKQRNITQIVLGKPRGRGLLEWFKSRSLLHKLVRESGQIDIHIVGDDESVAKAPKTFPLIPQSSFSQYGITCLVILAITLLCLWLNQWIGSRSIGMIYLLGIVIIALFVGRGPVLVAALLSAIIWDYVFLSPRFVTGIQGIENGFVVFTYFVVALVLGQFIARLRAQEKAERRREARISALYMLSQELSQAAGLDEIVIKVVEQLTHVFQAEVAVFLVNPYNNKLSGLPHWASTLKVTEKEAGVANWAFEHGKAAGRFTENLPLSKAYYVPLTTHKGCVGVLGINIPGIQSLSFDQKSLIQAFANQIALVIDRQRLAELAEHARVVAESERLSRTFLNSISHEMRTPLAVITAAVESLSKEDRLISSTDQRVLLEEIKSATFRLNRLVRNLLDMARIESGRFKLKREWTDIHDLINLALKETEKELAGRPLTVNIQQGIPLVRIDFSLMLEALNNLLLNAAIHTPAGSPVELNVSVKKNALVLQVADRGPGIDPEMLTRIFEKFYRGTGAPPGGTGLGLSIVKGVVDAHGGKVQVQNRPEGGAVFSIILPLENVPETFPMPQKDETSKV
ncbi:sensor histidine kinase [Methylacidiphilum kamchatkense]|uniref:histidine kinase n=1 Tax=Methylacidiphilum kamchatkense Kam1 TaxID=1202785 RepID=A0A516TNE2_9BACT|nr:sensor histidine kinase KdpD [Methylacidiphilum kamchatkense]QDQ42768.1 two-component system sensor histidine kinase KdpD [Methylacidiphilum kamchatkense Kam1]